jgi:hypothetical protein
MDGWAQVLYSKFFLRDVLGKVIPGAIAVLVLWHSFTSDSLADLPEKVFGAKDPYQWVLLLGSIPLCLLFGLALQIFGENLGAHSASPAPHHLFFQSIRKKGDNYKNWGQINDDFALRLELIRAKSKELGLDVIEQRDRLVYLKEGSGNLSLALAVGSIMGWLGKIGFSKLDLDFGPLVLFSLLVVPFWYVHWLHARRQASFEIGTLRKAGFLDVLTANDMKERLPKGW